MSELTTRTLTSFEYRGIQVEIAHPVAETDPTVLSISGRKNRYPWCYYLYLNLSKLEDAALQRELWAKPVVLRIGSLTKVWAYNKSAYLNDLPWHHGISFYEKMITPTNKLIKVGCDYDHYWDLDREYTLDDLVRDAKKTVDAVHDSAVYGKQEVAA